VNIAKNNCPGLSSLSPAEDALDGAREVSGIDWNPKDTHDRPAGFAGQNTRRHMNLLLNYAAHGFMLDVSETSGKLKTCSGVQISGQGSNAPTATLAQLRLRCPRIPARLICAVVVLTMLVRQLDARKAYHGAAEPAGYQKYIPSDRRPFLEIEAYPGFAFLLTGFDINFIC
jgi:hypothetical protein